MKPLTNETRYKMHATRIRNRKDAAGVPIKFLLTFEDWLKLWIDSGHADERGTRRGQYCMSRYDDLGHYEIGNVYIQLSSENFRQAALRGHHANKGRVHTEKTKQKVAIGVSAARANKYWSSKSGRETDGRRRPLTEEHKKAMAATVRAKSNIRALGGC